MRTDTQRFRRTVVSRAAITALWGTAAMLASQATLAQQQPSTALQRVEITGSNVPRNEVETPSPVQVITAETLKNSGYTTVSEVLRDITANGQGTLSQSFNAAFAAGASGVSLRGLTVGATLVLIDGHRMAPYPLSDDGERQFVDISSIPFNAIERIEILKDGASAVYGSDAIAGVVNVILKKNFKGTLATADYGDSQHGGGRTYNFSLTHGFGADQGNNGYIALEYRKADPIYLSQRSGDWTNQNFSGLGGSFGGQDLRGGAVNDFVSSPRIVGVPILQKAGSSTNAANTIFLGPNPGGCNFTSWRAGQCLYNNTWGQLQPPTENINVLGSYTLSLNKDWDANFKASVFESKANQVRLGATVPFGSFAGITTTGAGITPSIVGAIPAYTVPATYPGNTFGAPANVRAFLPDTGYKRVDATDSKSYRFVADLTGTLAGWDTKGSAGWTRVETESKYSGYLNPGNLYQALQSTTNPFLLTGGNSQAMMDFVAPTISNKSTDTLSFLEARGSRELMQLAGGPMGVAVGATLIHKELNAPDPVPNQLGTMNLNGAYAFGKETNYAVYGELVAPVTKMLELDGAVRYDHFSTYGSSTTPKVGFKFTPASWVGVRGTAAQGFRAPAPTENGTAGALFSFNLITDPLNCPNPANKSSAQNVQGACSFNPVYLQTTTKNLQPEKSKSYTLGLILEPVQNWSTTVDYYHITLDNQIIPAASLATYDPLANAVRGAPQTVTFGDGSVGTSPAGLIQYVNVPYVNGQSTVTSGIELDTRYRFNLGDMGKFTVGAMWTHILKYDQTLNGVTYHLAGTHGPSIIGGDTGNPKNRAQLTLQWERGPLTIATTTNYVGSYDVTDPSQGLSDCLSGLQAYNSYFDGTAVPNYYCRVKSFTYTNLTARYKITDKLTIRGAIDNLFDRQPPVDLQTYGSLNTNGSSNGTGIPYNPSLHQAGAVGRFFSIGLDYRF